MKIPEPEKLPSGNWRVRMRLGGVSTSVTASSAKEARRQAALIKAEYLAGKRNIQAPGDLTLSQAIDRYIEQRSNTLSPRTIRGYRIIQKGRFQECMGRQVNKISPAEWQGIINIEAGRCSPKTLKNAWGFIRSVVEDATGSFPPEVKLPGAVPKDKPFLTPEQIKVFVPAIAATQYAVPALLALSSMRISEIEALDWKDIPPDPQFIRVAGAVVRDENNQWVRKKQNKNATSHRNVPVLIPELQSAIESARQPSGKVLQLSQNGLRYGINRICRENDLPEVGIHGLRHSFASLAYHLQMPEKIAMEIGGWADASTMHRIYTHIAQSDITRYQAAMQNFYKNAHEIAHGKK